MQVGITRRDEQERLIAMLTCERDAEPWFAIIDHTVNRTAE
jgi:hypothetical protein